MSSQHYLYLEFWYSLENSVHSILFLTNLEIVNFTFQSVAREDRTLFDQNMVSIIVYHNSLNKTLRPNLRF